jgi:hypothetical protein
MTLGNGRRRIRAGVFLAWGALALSGFSLVAIAQEAYEPRELSEQAYPVVEFQFHPQLGEGWVEKTRAVVTLTWETPGAESTMVDSVYREMSWEVVAESDSGYLVRWDYGPQHHFLNGQKVESLVADYLEESSFGLSVAPTGEALWELSPGELAAAIMPPPDPDSYTGVTQKADSLADEVPGAKLDETPLTPLPQVPDSLIEPPAMEEIPRIYQFEEPPLAQRLAGIALKDWNKRLDVFYGQVWDEGESVFAVEELQIPGMKQQRLFSEIWLERVLNPDERPVAQVEVRYFTVPTDTLPLDDEGFLEFLSALGIEGLSSPALTDLVADGRGTWYIDAGRLLIYDGSSVIRGMVQQWPVEGASSSVTARFTIRRSRHAEALNPH